MRGEKFARVLLWIGGILIVVAIIAKLTPLMRVTMYFGARPSALLNLAEAVLLLAIGVLLARQRLEG